MEKYVAVLLFLEGIGNGQRHDHSTLTARVLSPIKVNHTHRSIHVQFAQHLTHPVDHLHWVLAL